MSAEKRGSERGKGGVAQTALPSSGVEDEAWSEALVHFYGSGMTGMRTSHFVVVDPLFYSPLTASPYMNSLFLSVRAPHHPSAPHHPPLFHQVKRALHGDNEWGPLFSLSRFDREVRPSTAGVVRMFGSRSSEEILELVSSAGSQPAKDPRVATAGREDVHERALLDEGMSPKVISLMREWIDQRIERQWWGGALAGDPGWQSSEPGDWESHGHSSTDLATMLTTDQMATRLEIGRTTLRRLEGSNQLFSVRLMGQAGQRAYPEFQTWAGINGEPLKQVLAKLVSLSGSLTLGFFASEDELLSGMTPVEVLLGQPLTDRLGLAVVDSARAKRLLTEDPPLRLKRVVYAAEHYFKKMR